MTSTRSTGSRGWTSSAIAALALATQGCGGGGNSGGNPAVPVAVAPMPTAPTPSPSPSPSPSSTATTPGPFAAGAVKDQQVEGPGICLGGTWRFDPKASATPGLNANVVVNSHQFILAGFEQPDVDTYLVGFDRLVAGAPSTKLVPETTVYDQFFVEELSDEGEFGIYRDTSPKAYPWSALGYFASPVSFCTFAVGLPSRDFPTLFTPYIGVVDGVSGSGDEARRLFNSGAKLNFDFPKGTGTIVLELAGRENPFGNFLAGSATPIDMVTGDLVAGANGSFTGQLKSASGRLTGSVQGQMFGPQAHDIGIAFELRDSGGVVIGGAAILSGDPGFGAWDY